MTCPILEIHPESPQPRLIAQAVAVLEKNGVIVYPTDSGYALGCRLGDRASMERILQIRQIDLSHHLTLVCHDLSELGQYARVDNQQYRLLKSLTPGAFTFILPDEDVPLNDAYEIQEKIGKRVDLIIDGGKCDNVATTVLDISEEGVRLIRQGKGVVPDVL